MLFVSNYYNLLRAGKFGSNFGNGRLAMLGNDAVAVVAAVVTTDFDGGFE